MTSIASLHVPTSTLHADFCSAFGPGALFAYIIGTTTQTRLEPEPRAASFQAHTAKQPSKTHRDRGTDEGPPPVDRLGSIRVGPLPALALAIWVFFFGVPHNRAP